MQDHQFNSAPEHWLPLDPPGNTKNPFKGDWRPSINKPSFDALGDQDATNLEVLFSKEEVFMALSDINGDKAPSPNSFPMTFWQFS